MDIKIRDQFIEQWEEYFPGAELPIAFFYSSEPGELEAGGEPSGFRCAIGDLARVRNGRSLCLSGDSVGCGGGKKYFGFTQELRPGFEYFLSCGIPGEMEGERYKKSPELVKEYMRDQPAFEAPEKYIVFKRWDMLESSDDPVAVIFFAGADVLSGLFTLANFDERDPQAVIAPFCAGCSSIVYHPYQEAKKERPKAVLGMFDVSARPSVPGNELSFSIPWAKFMGMMENMEESFLKTGSWFKLRKRIAQSTQC